MPDNPILLSVRPQYAEKIFEGSKTVELRRVRPKYINKGTLVLIYVSSPVKSLSGAFKIDRIVEKTPSKLWGMVHKKAGVTRKEFNAYYKGVSIGIGIFFSEFFPLSKPIELQDLKQKTSAFHPPQGFRYATPSDLALPQIAEIISADRKLSRTKGGQK